MLTAVAEARELGYALDDGEQELGVRCVAVPLTGLPFLAAISISGPGGRVKTDDVPRIAPEMQAVAAQISRNFRSHDQQHSLRSANFESVS